MFVTAVYAMETNESHMGLDNETARLTGTPREFTQVLLIHNSGVANQKITSVNSHRPGITMISTGAVGKAVGPGHSLRVTVTYRVTNCNTARHTGAFPVRIGFERWWGTHTTTFLDRGQPPTSGAYDACR